MFVLSARGRALLAATLSLLAPAVATAQGWSYTVTTSTQSPMMNGVTFVAKVVGDSAGSRMDIERASLGPVTAGDYVLFRPGMMVFVYPARREFTEIDPLRMTSAALAAAGASMHVTKVHVSAERIGNEVVSGRPTRHVRLTQDYALEVDAMSGHQEVSNHVVVELWLADIAAMPNPFTSPSLAGRDPGPDNPLAELITQSRAAMKTLGPGFPVKQVTKSSTATPGGSMDIVQTTEVSDLAPAVVDRAALVVPAGFTKVAFGARGP